MTPPGAGRLHLGWQYATPHPDPGPPPRPPDPPGPERLDPAWVAAQRREERLISRPLRRGLLAAVAGAAAACGAAGAGWLPGPAAALGVTGCGLAAAASGYGWWRGERALRSRVSAERSRIGLLRAGQRRELSAGQAGHVRRVQAWQAARAAHDGQKRWYGVSLPDGISRVDIAGGTLPGWSAMLATAAGYRLAAGGEVTVLDLTEGSAGLELIAAARPAGVEPLVWVLPADLPALDLTAHLAPAELADVLSLVASAAEEQGPGRDLSLDNAILERVIEVLGGSATVAGVAAALRVLAQAGDPRDDVAAGLISVAQADRLAAMFGRGAAERVVVERAWVLEAQLRKLAGAGTAPAPPWSGPLRVLAVSPRAGSVGAQVLSAFLALSLTHALRGARPARPWQHTVFALGADRLRGDILDRLSDACESTGTGLVLAYRSIRPHVKPRLGRGNAAVAFMRLGNAEDAKAASEQLGTEQRFVLSQLTATIGLSVTDTTAGSYTSTAGSVSSQAGSWSVSDSRSRAAGLSRAGSGLLPWPAGSSRSSQASDSRSIAASESVSTGLNTSTAWGVTTSRAVGGSDSFAAGLQRSREFLVEPHELQQLPASAMIVSYAGPGGRQVVLADANPGLAGLPAATPLTLEESRMQAAVPGPRPVPGPERAGPERAAPAPPGPPAGTGHLPADLGAFPPRPDWRPAGPDPARGGTRAACRQR